MDTLTHLVVGFGLAGLAQLDPAISGDATASTAVLIGTVLGSQAPDADTVLRMKGNATYIRNHRGWSHSLPAVLLWTGGITAGLSAFFSDVSALHLGLWVLLAVSFHVFSDVFNTYGTQALLPFSGKWLQWNIIHIFDPFLFVSHSIAIAAWFVGAAPPQRIFPILYGVVAAYYVWRSLAHRLLKKRIERIDPEDGQGARYTIIPTVSWDVWHILRADSDGSYRIGEWRNGGLAWLDRASCAAHRAVDESKKHPDVQAFLYFTNYACAELRERDFGYEVRWVDIRYRHRKQYPFVAVVLMDWNYEPLDSYVGWLSSDRLNKRLGLDATS